MVNRMKKISKITTFLVVSGLFLLIPLTSSQVLAENANVDLTFFPPYLLGTVTSLFYYYCFWAIGRNLLIGLYQIRFLR